MTWYPSWYPLEEREPWSTTFVDYVVHADGRWEARSPQAIAHEAAKQAKRRDEWRRKAGLT